LLDTAKTVEDMDLPGLKLHKLKGRRRGNWAVHVSANQRITFTIQDGDVFDVNYEDYH
jgi:proteic killer suppression protein